MRWFEGAAWRFLGEQEGAEEPGASGLSPFFSWAGAAQSPPQATCSAWPLAPDLLSKLASKNFLNCVVIRYHK